MTRNKDLNTFDIYRVDGFYENDSEKTTELFCMYIQQFINLKEMPFEYREMALALLQKEKNPKKACYFVGKCENNANSVAEKMIKKLIAYKSTTAQHKKEIVQELIADLSAL